MFCFVWLLEPLSTSIRSSGPLHIIRFSIQSHVSLHSASRASSSGDIQVHIFIWRSKPHPHSVFRAIICFFYYLFRVPSRGFGSALRVLMSIFHSIHHHFPPFWRSEPLGTLLQAFWAISFLFFNFNVQSHYYVWRLPPLPYFSFSLAFRAVFFFFIPIHA